MTARGQFANRLPMPVLVAHHSAATALRPLHALLAAPSWLFLGTLTVMLFRPPDAKLYGLDRIAFFLLLFVVVLRLLALRQSLLTADPVLWPMGALLLLGLQRVVSQPYEAQNWSVFAAQWAVPFALYFAAGSVFHDAPSRRRFENYALLVLVYLCLTAIFFLFDAKQLILPRYLLDPGLGIHADRARGPFLQAVANGVTLNILGLVALDGYRRGRLNGAAASLLLAGLALAVLATRTRAVWLSFAGSMAVLAVSSSSRRVRRACQLLILAGTVAALTVLLVRDGDNAFGARLEDRDPVDFRVVMYRTGLEMFLEKPLIGWPAKEVQPELAKRVHDFRPRAFFFHNTFLEIAVLDGLLGLMLYGWLVLDLFRLGSRKRPHAAPPEGTFLDTGFRSLWPVIVGVYLINAVFVVMNYQFVNGLLFAIAGMLAAQNRRARSVLAAPDVSGVSPWSG